MELWLAIASILAALTLTPKGPTLPPVEFTSGTIRFSLLSRVRVLCLILFPPSNSHPVCFDCKVRPRNERAEAMINEAISALK